MGAKRRLLEPTHAQPVQRHLGLALRDQVGQRPGAAAGQGPAPGTVAGVHKHFGAAHAYIVEGGFGYEHGEVFAGDYMVEAGGITHQPFTGPNGLILLGFIWGGSFFFARYAVAYVDIAGGFELDVVAA